MTLGAVPSNIVYVSDMILPDGGNEEQVKEIFGQYGSVQHVRLLSGNHGASRCAIVRYASMEEATTVIALLNGNCPQGLSSPVQIKYANAPGGSSGGGVAPSRGAPAASARFSPYGNGNAGVNIAGLGMPGMAGMPGMSGMAGMAGMAGMGGMGGVPGMGMGMGAGLGNVALSPPGPGPVGPDGISMDMICTALEKSGSLPGGSDFKDESACLYVGNLPSDTTDIHLYRMFCSFGPLAPNGIKTRYNQRPPAGAYGFVNYLIPASADAAIQTLNGQMLPDGQQLKVSRKQQKAITA